MNNLESEFKKSTEILKMTKSEKNIAKDQAVNSILISNYSTKRKAKELAQVIKKYKVNGILWQKANTNQLLISINERNIKMLKPIKNNELCHHVFSFNGIGIQLIERDNRFIIYVNTIELVSYMDKIDAENFGIKLITAIKNNDLQ